MFPTAGRLALSMGVAGGKATLSKGPFETGVTLQA